MLNSMREGSGARFIKIIALGFVMLGVGGMVFMDVGGFFRGGVTDTNLAKVGSTTITLPAFERVATQATRAQNMDMQEAYRFGLLKNILDEMVMRELIRQEALKQGIQISREQIAADVHEFVKTQMQPGETAQMTLNRLLQSQGLSEADIIASIRQSQTSLLMEKPLQQAVAYVPRLTTEAMARIQAERRDIVFMTLTPETAGADIKADEDTLKGYYETVKDQYQIPEQRTFRAISLRADDVKSGISVTDADVEAAFNERKDQFRIGERRRIEQIVVTDEAQAKQIAETARTSKNLKASAPQNTYREPMEAELAELPPELAAPVFAADKSTVLNPIKTPLGWHIVHLLDITPARSQSFEEVKADLRKELESDALHMEMEARIAKIDEALGQGETLDDMAKSMDLEIVTVGPIDAEGRFDAAKESDQLLVTLGQNRDLLSSLFELMEGETGDLAEINDSIYAVFSLQAVTPTRDRDFAEIKTELEKKWLSEKREEALVRLVEKLTGELSRKEKTFEDAAKEAGVVVKTVRDISRESKVAGLNDPVALTRLFDETDLSNIVKVPLGSNIVIAKVLDARIPAAGEATVSDTAKAQWRKMSEQAIVSLYAADLRREHGVRINQKLLDNRYGATADEQP